jgi:integrase
LSPQVVREWHAVTLIDKPTYRAHDYSLLRTILGQAVKDQVLASNPCAIAKAGSSKRVHVIRPATLEELEKIVTAMPERLRLMTLLAAWCGLRFGELTELRRSDVDTKRELPRVRRGVVRASGKVLVKKPKSDAGVRNVAIPPHLMPMLREHLLQFTAPEPDGLLFPATGNGHLAPSTLYRHFYSARTAAGREDLRWHDLRHTGAVLAAQAGATLADLMARLGHSTPGAAMKYQHAAEGRDVLLAKALSRIAKKQA